MAWRLVMMIAAGVSGSWAGRGVIVRQGRRMGVWPRAVRRAAVAVAPGSGRVIRMFTGQKCRAGCRF
jgi:hypothetical protein